METTTTLKELVLYVVCTTLNGSGADFSQEGALCALDVLSVSGLLNYFGKVDLAADEGQERDDKGIKIRPVLLRKGSTHLALYGVGNVKDARMHYELRSNRVKMYMPSGGTVAEEDWFNMLLIHQNR
jgi:double-strand break repair protein MRE11